MKNYILFVLFWSLTCTAIDGQDVYRHETTFENTSRYFTKLNHTNLNDHPEAIIFIMPNWNTNGAGVTGMDYDQNAGVWYDTRDSVWTIFNQDTTQDLKKGVTFNVLIAPPGDKHYFKVKATQGSIAANGFPNGFVIDADATNNKTNAFILVTQNRDSVFNNNSPIVHYANGNWRISNNGYLAYYNGLTTETNSFMLKGARFNVMVIEDHVVSGFANALAFKHIADIPNTYNLDPGHGTFLNNQYINGLTDRLIFAIPYWGHGAQDQTNDSSGGGPYNEGPIMVRYDHPDDQWNYREEKWSIFNTNYYPLPFCPSGAKFHIVAIKPQP
ncbi:MAG: hypothetical protein IPK94_07805 [Saprospiraceae bacterium]|nr:hypothetical protein [Saprospiraceae bacterium]